MRQYTVFFITLVLLGSSTHAQQPAGDDTLSIYFRQAYAAVSRDVAAAVELMPEEHLGFRPAGAIDEVRTFGEIATHLAQVSAFVCSMGDGKPSPTIGSTVARDKARLLAALAETDERCTAYLATVTDTALKDVLTAGAAERRLQAVRGNSIVFAIAHANEHYGNLVTYLRAKGLVPPATPSQARFLSAARRP